MAFNELFRLVSLRHSHASTNESDSPPTSDPRLRHRRLFEHQAQELASPRENKLQELKIRQAELSRKVKQLESVQREVIAAYMLEGPEEPVRTVAAAAHGVTARATSHANVGAVTSVALRDRSRFVERVETRLNDAENTLFQDAIARVPGSALGNLGDMVTLLDSGSFANEANTLCAQITAIEENTDDDLPTVQPQTSTNPIVAAIGWGDLIVARETLVGYQAHEIAHIENILPGEAKLRQHQRVSKTEEVQESETLTEKESEKDSQTTDRYELQAESQKTINQDFSVSAAVNTSGQYGLTQVDTSLDAAFSQSESQSRSSTINTAREIINKAVERTFERVRRMRRLTVTEEIRELNRHQLSNIGGSTEAISGIYLWVEKIQKIELRHYGTRMMVEFHVPEPAVSLHERAAVPQSRKKLAPFNVSPSDIHPGNYMCLAQRYGAVDVEPQPTLFVQVGYGWVSKLNEEDEAWGEDQFSSLVNIPDGYRPLEARVTWSGLQGPPPASVILPGGTVVTPSVQQEFNFAFAVGGRSRGNAHFSSDAEVLLPLPLDCDWPQGVPVSGRVHGAWDGAMYVQVTLRCMRTAEALDAWRLRTWQALRDGYETLERKAVQDAQLLANERNPLRIVISDAPAIENRRIERGELQKWAIKSMRLVPQNFNAIEQAGEFQEMSPLLAEAQAPIVRFYEDAFEWEHMNYFLYPYHWARRASWRMRTSTQATDRHHQAFVEAGAARVIVPITPGFEDKVAWFLDPMNAGMNELERILAKPPTSVASASSNGFRDLWTELLTERMPDVARGSGTLSVESGAVEVHINSAVIEESQWRVSERRDIGRELYIAGGRYELTAVANENTFSLDRPYEGESDSRAVYVAGSTPFGPPWTVNVPTTLVVLADNKAALSQLV